MVLYLGTTAEVAGRGPFSREKVTSDAKASWDTYFHVLCCLFIGSKLLAIRSFFISARGTAAPSLSGIQQSRRWKKFRDVNNSGVQGTKRIGVDHEVVVGALPDSWKLCTVLVLLCGAKPT